MSEELENARRERDEAFAEFVDASAKSVRFNVKAQAARKRYTLAADEVRALERDVLAYPITNHNSNV
jgi:hypothetical protein